MLKNHYLFHQHRSKSSTFNENPCRFLRKMQKSEKTITFYMKNLQKERLCFIFLAFFQFLTRGTLAEPIFGPSAYLGLTSLYIICPMRTPISAAVGEQPKTYHQRTKTNPQNHLVVGT